MLILESSNQRPSGWEPSQELWAYNGPQLYAKHQHAPRHDGIGSSQSAFTNGGADAGHVFNPSQYPSFKPWVNDTASSYFICSERSAMIEYHEYSPNDKAPRYETGETGTSVAYGRCSIQPMELHMIYKSPVNSIQI